MNWACLNGLLGYLRLYAQLLPANFKNFWQVPNLLLQKLPIEVFTAITKVTFTPRTEASGVSSSIYQSAAQRLRGMLTSTPRLTQACRKLLTSKALSVLINKPSKRSSATEPLVRWRRNSLLGNDNETQNGRLSTRPFF